MLISVIIPTYNCGQFIIESIQSVRAQSIHDHDLEIIVVDDGSTDDTPDILNRMKDGNIRVIRTINQGMGKARNEGLRTARGDFIAFNDADDRWRPNKLQQQLNILNAEPEVGVVFTDFVRFTKVRYLPQTQFSFFPELSTVPKTNTKCGTGMRLTCPESFTSLISFSQFATWIQTMLFRTECVRDLSFPEDRRVTADAHYCFSVYQRTTAAYIAEPLVEVRRHDANSTLDLFKLELDTLSMLHDLNAAPLNSMQKAALRRRLGIAELDIAKKYINQRKPMRAAKHIWDAFRYPGLVTRVHKSIARRLFSNVRSNGDGR